MNCTDLAIETTCLKHLSVAKSEPAPNDGGANLELSHYAKRSDAATHLEVCSLKEFIVTNEFARNSTKYIPDELSRRFKAI